MTNKHVSVGWLHVTTDARGAGRHLFLVMAGAGFDAAIVAGASPALKSHLGHGAYIVSGMRSVGRSPTPMQVDVEGQPVMSGVAQGVVIGNCGTLTMGLDLMPDANLDDRGP